MIWRLLSAPGHDRGAAHPPRFTGRSRKFSDEKVISILKEADAGAKVADLCRKHGMSDATYCKWKVKFSGMEVSQLRRLKDLESEDNRMKRMCADLSLTHQALQDAV